MRNLLTAFGILFFGLFLAMMIGTMKPKPEKVVEQAPAPVAVNTIIATEIDHPIQVISHGKIAAAIDIDLTTEVAGKIIWVSDKFVQGGSFAKNEVILKIDPTQYEAETAEAKALVTQAEELQQTEKARANQAKKEWRDLGSDEANNLFLRKPQLASAEAQLAAAKAKLKRAENALAKTQIRLPFASFITSTDANLGQFVQAGKKIAEVYAQNDLQVSLPISQKQLELLNISLPVKKDELPSVELNGKIGARSVSWQGDIVSNSAKFDDNNQLLNFLVKLKKSDIKALPGQYVEAKISGKTLPQVFLIPEDAFHDKRFILCIDENNRVQFIAAKYLSREDHRIYIQADITNGTIIISDRMPLATEGMLVRSKEP